MKNTQKQSIKSRIRRIKTQHNDLAHINEQSLFNQTKKLHNNSINYAQFADKVTDRLFAIKPLQIGFVQSFTLKDDPKFKQIRHLLQKYNEQALHYDQKSAPGLHLKTIVMDSMLKFIRLLMQAPDAIGKKRILDISYYWFKKNLDTSKKQRKSKENLQKQVRNILLESKLIPKAIIDKQLLSQKLKQQLYNYQIQARTNYKQLDAPGVQLENYITHKIGFVNQHQKNQNINNQPKTIEDLKQEKWKKRIVFKKPYIEQPNYEQPEEENQKDNKNMIIENNQDPNSIININPNQQSDKPPGQSTSPQVQDPPIPPGMQQIMGMGDQQQQQQQPQQEQKKRGKLDPLVKVFLMDRQKRIKTQGQISADNKIQFIRNKKLQENRKDQGYAQFISQWAGTRARFKSELSRKIQSIKAFSSITKVKKDVLQPNNEDSKTRIQHTINRVKLNQTLKQYGCYLHKQPIRQVLNTQTSMSLYDRKRIKTQASSSFRPFSTVIEDHKRLDEKYQYLDQISILKQRFAKYKLYTPLDNLKKAILHPEEKQVDWADVEKWGGENVELPRMNMISNPFANFGKKKKKKKGKKKK